MVDKAGTSGSETLDGTSGNDVLNAANGGTDTLNGGAGDDRLIADGGGDKLYGGTGTDIADLRLQYMKTGVLIDMADQLEATDGTSNLYDVFDNNGNVVVSLNSVERLFFYGGSGNDVVTGGKLADRIDGGKGGDVIRGGGGDDQIFGHAGNLSLSGDAGNDQISIDGFVRNISGGAGTDTLTITGTEGFDAKGHVGELFGIEQIFVKAGLSPISFSQDDARSFADKTDIGYQIVVKDVADGNGGFLGATITASEFRDSVKGGQGADHLIGNKGNDVLYGGAGNDLLEGGIGGDRLYGEAGDDRFIVNSGPGQQSDVLIDGGTGIDSVNLNEQFLTTDLLVDFRDPTVAQTINGSTFVNIEVLDYDGSQGVDTVFGGSLADKINGREGNDVISGGGGNDLLFGGNGDDTAVYTGNRADYTITKNGNSFTVVDSVAGRDGSDQISQFEHIQFADGVIMV